MMMKEKLIQTHRGFHIEGAMENSMEAFRQAKIKNCEMIEFDVRLTKDYVPVIYHDVTLQRLHKVRLKVSDLTWRELHSLAPNVPTLEEVLTARDIPEYLNVELKTDAVVDPALEIQAAELVQKHKAQERVVFSSFNPFSLIRMRGLAPEVARALLVTEEKEEKNYWFLRQMSLLPLTEALYLHWDQSMTTPERVAAFREKGYKIATYTVNDPTRARELVEWGVESIISDSLLSLEPAPL